MIDTLNTSISRIYDFLDDNQDYKDISYFLLNTELYESEYFLAASNEVKILSRKVRTDLTKLSELIAKLELALIECKSLIDIEKRKNKKFETQYKKYFKSK